MHPGHAPSVHLLVQLDTYLDGEMKNTLGDPLYQGGMLWNLNPKQGVNGHFYVPQEAA